MAPGRPASFDLGRTVIDPLNPVTNAKVAARITSKKRTPEEQAEIPELPRGFYAWHDEGWPE